MIARETVAVVLILAVFTPAAWATLPAQNPLARQAPLMELLASPVEPIPQTPGQETPLEFAQRAIRRRATQVDTSAHVETPEVSRPKSAGIAIGLAAAVPGTGQLYLGQKHGYVQLGAEALAWLSFFSLEKSGTDKQSQYRSFVGDATAAALDPNVRWQFERYCPNPVDCDSTDYSDLRRQWDEDRTRFYESITDPRYARGWSDTTAAARYEQMRDQANRFLRLARYATAVVVVNHVVSLIDAVHSTRHLRVSRAVPRLTIDWAFKPVGRSAPRGHAAFVYKF
jgi:hypothetical protein